MPDTFNAADQSAYKFYAAFLRAKDPATGMSTVTILAKLLQAVGEGGHLPPVNRGAMSPEAGDAAQRFVDWVNSFQTPC